jgi:fimbrial isopeptide formation D2 family protein/LPXTG-motif cell wall-anchored protein
VDNAEVTITGLDESVARTFEVYQVFKGTYNSTEGTFSELKWGSGVTSYNSTAVTADALVADSVLDALGNDARAIVDKLVLGTATKTVQSNAETLTIDGLADGYYVIKDTTNMDNKDDANSAWIVQVAADGKTTSIAVKKETPSVDKQVLDETADAEAGATDGWGESADHAINESFQFKLTATVPIGENYAAYDTYQLTFNDSMSEGVTFESIESVKISSATLTGDDAITLADTQYDETATETANKNGLNWSLTINDIKALVNAGGDIFGKEEIKVEVIYNAHLNENAIVDTADRTGGTAANTNCNKVDLQYSNNPDSTGTGLSLGRTPEDYVWVFTYEVDNTKYKVSVADGNELQGAGFTLYSDSAMTQAIKLIENGDGTYTVAADTTSGSVTEMVSAADGKFNIKGLDAGTYYLRETTVPRDYNAADDITIEIGATHKEQADGTVNLTLTGIDNGVENQIVDTKNSTLPSTGGMGTTLFILGGGLTAAAAGIYLVSKKRAKEEDAQ